MQSPGNNFKGIIFLGKAFLITAGKVEVIIHFLPQRPQHGVGRIPGRPVAGQLF